MLATRILGTLATSHRLEVKERLKAAEKEKGRRNVIQVLANAAIPSFFGLLAFIFPNLVYPFTLMLAASFSSATADTLSSELGTVYGKKFYNILTLQKDKRGLDGVISLEGTLFGIAGSVIIAILYALDFGWSLSLAWIVLAGTLGNLTDSLLGATLQRRHYINNNGVNLLNTIVAAGSAFLLSSLE